MKIRLQNRNSQRDREGSQIHFKMSKVEVTLALYNVEYIKWRSISGARAHWVGSLDTPSHATKGKKCANGTGLFRGVNPGGWGGVATPRFWAGGRRRGVIDGFRKKYSVFCTESMIENVFFKENFVELRTKKRSSEIFAWKIRNVSGKSDFFRFESRISWTGFTTPQISKRIDPAVIHDSYNACF